jgi:hypothetical protein
VTLFCNGFRERRGARELRAIDFGRVLMRPVGCVADPQTAGFRRRGRDPLPKASLRARSCFDANSCWSDAVENLETPQHDDDGRYQGGNGQHTLQGSHSHDTLRFPTPSSGLFDSRNRRQSAGHICGDVIRHLWFAGHRGSRQQKARWPQGLCLNGGAAVLCRGLAFHWTVGQRMVRSR